MKKLLRPKETAAALGVHISTLYAWLDSRSPYHDREFPQPFSLSPHSRAKFFLASEIDSFVAKKAASRDLPVGAAPQLKRPARRHRVTVAANGEDSTDGMSPEDRLQRAA